MDIIYHDVGGTHSVIVASAIHLNKLPTDKRPTKEEILNLPRFDKVNQQEHGHLLYQGDDEFGNSVYTVGYKYSSKIALPLIKDTYNLIGNANDDLLLVDTKPTINYTMKIGGFLSRSLGIVGVGRPIVTNGVLNAYSKIVKLVVDVKRKLEVETNQG
ncbi:DUF3189 family protein [Natroniella sulfidigena]|uniref:DUF3189 family protein n=1 Tax=Natroniella sulfidigena TaxID=723921 RepID=UPI00200B3035|nr:DUF3189 family protein [Natroniella sulfidigena]MCK8817237.1 DUF3189 family protein [Natroniella sulfidigena]